MHALAVVLEKPEHLVAQPAGAEPSPATKTSWSTSSGAASAPAPSDCCGPAACRTFPAWAIRWCRATSRSAAWCVAGQPLGRARRRAGVRARRATASAMCAACSAAPHRALVVPGAARLAARRRRWASRASCWRWPPPRITRSAQPARRAAGADRRPWRARTAAGAPRADRRTAPAPTVWETNPTRADGAEGYEVVDPAMTTRQRLPRHLRRQRRRHAARHPDRPRWRPGGEIVLAGFYSEPLSLRVSARLHARGAPARRRRMAADDLSGRHAAGRVRPAVARRPDHPPREAADALAAPTAPHSTIRPA